MTELVSSIHTLAGVISLYSLLKILGSLSLILLSLTELVIDVTLYIEERSIVRLVLLCKCDELEES